MRSLKSDLIWALTVISVYWGAMVLVGCDEQKFQADHPMEAEIIEEVVEVAEGTVETVVEGEMHLPKGSLGPVFQHKVFVPPSEATKP